MLSLTIVGIDGKKLRAQNGQNNVFIRNRVDNIEKKIELKIQEYLEEFEVNDISETEKMKLPVASGEGI